MTSGRSVDGRQQIRRNLDVVAEQLSLGDLQVGPEDLREIGDLAGDRRSAARSRRRAARPRAPAADSTTAFEAVVACGRRRDGADTDPRPRASSLTTSFALLSSRSPRYTGCRSLPSSVHSVNFTCATRSGRTQCAGSLDLSGVENGDFAICARLQQRPDARQLFLIEPGARVADVLRAGRPRRRRGAARRNTAASGAAPSSRRRRIPARGRP